MRKIKVLKAFNLVNSKGNRLQLQLGAITEGLRDEYPIFSSDQGYRWRFIGKEIPMPVRSMYWFNGFPEGTMLNWLKENDWYPQTCVFMDDGKAKVYELPKGDEELGEIDLLGTDQYPALGNYDHPIFEKIIRELVSNGRKTSACRLYRYAHGGKLSKALEAVNVIITK